MIKDNMVNGFKEGVSSAADRQKKRVFTDCYSTTRIRAAAELSLSARSTLVIEYFMLITKDHPWPCGFSPFCHFKHHFTHSEDGNADWLPGHSPQTADSQKLIQKPTWFIWMLIGEGRNCAGSRWEVCHQNHLSAVLSNTTVVKQHHHSRCTEATVCLLCCFYSVAVFVSYRMCQSNAPSPPQPLNR